MRFLLDEMYPPSAAAGLRSLGHDATDVRELGLLAVPDVDILTRAVEADRVLITENMRDFAPLVERRVVQGRPLIPVVFALKSALPKGSGAMGAALAERLNDWSLKHPEPYRHVHWLDATPPRTPRRRSRRSGEGG